MWSWIARFLYHKREYLRMKWGVFIYNFSWPDYVQWFEGPLVKASMAIPFVGYLILFNDTVVEHLTFRNLTSSDVAQTGLSMGARLKFIYCGLLCLSVASIIYYLRRPYALRIGRDQFEYVERALVHFTVENYIDINSTIRHSNFDPYTSHGKYHDSEFENFLSAATGGGQNNVHWIEAKNKFEGLLRSMLIEHYFRQKISRRDWLVVALAFASLGYLLLLVPSAELFLKVLHAILKSLL
jgi:hypothetical protein